MCTDDDIGEGLLRRWSSGGRLVTSGGGASLAVHPVQQHGHSGVDAYWVIDGLVWAGRRQPHVTSDRTGGPNLAFEAGSLSVACERTASVSLEPAPLTQTDVLDHIDFGSAGPDGIVDGGSVLLVARDAVFNLFHSLGDVFNAWCVLQMVPCDRIVLIDDSPDGPFLDLWRSLGRGEPVRIAELEGRVRFARAVLCPPSGCALIWKHHWGGPPECVRAPSPLLQRFAREVRHGLGISEGAGTAGATQPRITVIDRKIGWAGRAPRRWSDPVRLVDALSRAVPGAAVVLVDFAELSIAQQVLLAAETDVLVGMWGAGLAHAVWQRPGAAVVEVWPSEDGIPACFGNLARWTGLRYRAVPGSVPFDEDDVEVIEVDPKKVAEAVAEMVAGLPAP